MSTLTICCIIISILFIIINLIRQEYTWVLLWVLILALNIYAGYLQKNHDPSGDVIETHVIQDVKGYSIDSTTVINGTDTTRTYVLTYWK